MNNHGRGCGLSRGTGPRVSRPGLTPTLSDQLPLRVCLRALCILTVREYVFSTYGPDSQEWPHEGVTLNLTPPPYTGYTRRNTRFVLPQQYVNMHSPRMARTHRLAFTRYCYAQYCMLYSIKTGGRGGVRISRNSIAIVLQPCGQCRWGGQ